MQQFFDTAFSFPAVVFTASTIFFLGFWTVSTVIGAGMNALDDFDLDFDADSDIEVDGGSDVDIDADSSGGLLRAALEFLGVTGMPLLISINLLSLFSWVIVMIGVTVLGGSDASVGWLLGIPLLIGSFLAGGFLTGRLAKRFAHVFVPTQALRRRQLVGSVCTITTQSVTSTFGQAEVRDEEGGSLLVQVRCAKENDLRAGDRALIFDLDADAGIFQISPDRDLAR